MIAGITGKQELFNYVARHLLKQNAKSINADRSGCMYHTMDGRQCAAGCLIEREHYRTSLEGGDVTNLCVRTAIADSIGRELVGWDGPDPIQGSESEMILQLQKLHDGHQPDEWESRLRDIAHAHKLEFPANLLEVS